METITSFFVQNITSLVSDFGYLAVFLLMTAESALIPIPSEITMPFAGFLAQRGLLSFWLVILSGALGNLVGSWLAWYLGLRGEAFARALIKKWGKWVLVSEGELDTGISLFARFGQFITFFSRLLPIIRTYISLPAGIAKMPFVPFSILTFSGSLLWSAFLTYLGFVLGENWEALEVYFRPFQFVIVGTGVVLGVLYVWYKIKKIKKEG